MRTSTLARAGRAALVLAPVLSGMLLSSCLTPVSPLHRVALPAEEPADSASSNSSAATAASFVPVPREDAKSGWSFDLTPYVWGTRSDTELTAEGLKSAGTVKFSDLQLGYQLHATATNGDWALFTDLTYLPLNADLTSGGTSASTNLDAVFLELGVKYNLTELSAGGLGSLAIDVVGGNRYYRADTSIDVLSGGSVASDRDWIDIFFGSEARLQATKMLTVRARADVGGFDIGGSKLAWQGILEAGLQLSPSATLSAGYRVLDVDYNDIVNGAPFQFDVQVHGPFVGLLLHF